MKASEVIAEACGWIGYKGKKKPTDDITAFEAPNGVGDYNYFAAELYKAGFYNGNKNGYDWCACFVDCMFYLASGMNKELCNKVNPQNKKGLGAGCDYAAGAYTALGMGGFFPKVGDKGFILDKKGNSVHCVLVEEVDLEGQIITTIEGNTENDMVERKVRSLVGDLRMYFGHPDYEPEEVVTDNTLLAEYSVKLAKVEDELNLTKIKLEKSENELTTLKEKGQNLKNAVTAFVSLT